MMMTAAAHQVHLTAASVPRKQLTTRSARRSAPVCCNGNAKSVARSPDAVPAVSYSKREMGVLGMQSLVSAVVAQIVVAENASAFLGIGEGKARQEQYTKATEELVSLIKDNLSTPRDDPELEEKVRVLRLKINDWVSRYRRDTEFSGKPSYSQLYTAVNALAGHFSSFGTKIPLPKKRADRVLQEVALAERALAAGR